MPKTERYTDEEILDACRVVVARGEDPTYGRLRAAGYPCCGKRLRLLRDEAVRSGALILPANSLVRLGVVHEILSGPWLDAREPRRRPDTPMPTTASQFIRIERRVLSGPIRRDAYMSLKHCSIQLRRGLVQWQFYFGGQRPRKWKAVVRKNQKQASGPPGP